MKKQLCLMLALLMLVGALGGCTEKLPELSPTYSYTPRLQGVTAYRATAWDNYIVTRMKTAIYDRTTGEIKYGLCEDPECDGTCPVEDGVRITGFSGTRIYFNTLSKEPYYGYCDILTGEVVCLLKITFDEMLPMRPMFVDGDWVYITRKHLKEGGNPENSDDYVKHLSRIPKDGGREELVYAMRGNAETLILVHEGIMYSWYQSKIWRTDLETWEPKIVHDFEASELDNMGDCWYLDGNLYFNTIVNDRDKFIVRMDAQTGEWHYVVDIPVVTYYITNEAVYFSPVEERQVSDPTRYPPGSNDAKSVIYSATLYACDLDGSNVRAVWTDKSGVLDFTSYYTVVDGIYYGWLAEFDIDKNSWGELYFAEIHLDTGDIIPATVVE